MTLENDLTPSSIVPMILLALKTQLETRLIADVPETNPTRALLVKVGRFAENPLDKTVSVAISGGDYEDPAFMDGRIDNPRFNDITIKYLPVGEIGGGTYWWRRGTINYQCFFVRDRREEEVSLQYAYDFQGRLLRAIDDIALDALTDDYSEQAYNPVYVEGCSLFESGGNKQYIWRGKVRWRVLTWRP